MTRCPREHCKGALYIDGDAIERCLLCGRPSNPVRIEDVLDVPAPRWEQPREKGYRFVCLDCPTAVSNQGTRCKDCYKRWRRTPEGQKRFAHKNKTANITLIPTHDKSFVFPTAVRL